MSDLSGFRSEVLALLDGGHKTYQDMIDIWERWASNDEWYLSLSARDYETFMEFARATYEFAANVVLKSREGKGV